MFKHLFEALEETELQKRPALTCCIGNSAYDKEKVPEALTNMQHVLFWGTLV